MSKIIITGGAGFIGSHLGDSLIADGHEILVIDNLTSGKKEFVNKKAKFVKEDVRNFKKLDKLFKGADVVFHLAANPVVQDSINDPIGTHEINVTGTLNVLTAAKNNNLKKLVFSSSCAAYGNVTTLPIKEDHAMNPESPYGLHKLIAEQYCRIFSKLYGFPTICLRYFNVFGPRKLACGSYPMVIPIFLQQKKEGKKLTIVGDGESTRDYVHVSDIVRANILAWKSEIGDGRAINIGSGRQVSVNEIAKIIGGESINLPPRVGEMRYVEADASLAKKYLGWEPRVSLETGMQELK